MKRYRLFFSFLIIVLQGSSLALASESLCKSDEKIVFSCPVGHEKTVSVCASKSLSNGGYIQYRFGRKDKIDLSVPSTTKASDVSIDGNSDGNRSGGTFIRFRKGVYSYVVVSLFNMPSDPETGCNGEPCEQVGVIVEKSGNVISRLSCQGTFGAEITDFNMPDIPLAKDYWPSWHSVKKRY